MTNLKELAERGKEMAALTYEETYEELVKGIERDNEFRLSMFFEAHRVDDDLPTIYKEFANSLGVAVEELTVSDRTRAMLNHLLEETEDD